MDAELTRNLEKIERLTRDEDYEQALRLANDLLRERPEEVTIWRAKSHIMALEGNYDAAIKDISNAIRIRPEEPDYFFTRGRFLFAHGKYVEAIEDFTRTLELSEQQQSDLHVEAAHFFRADAYARLKLYDKAKADCGKIPDNAPMWTDRLRCKADILADCRQ